MLHDSLVEEIMSSLAFSNRVLRQLLQQTKVTPDVSVLSPPRKTIKHRRLSKHNIFFHSVVIRDGDNEQITYQEY